MIYKPSGDRPVQVSPSDLDRTQVRRLRRATAPRPARAEREHRAVIVAATGLPAATVDRIRDRLLGCPSPALAGYLEGVAYPYERADFGDA